MITFTGITFDPNFNQKTESNFDSCQKFIDSEVVRLSDPYVPVDSTMLKKSGISGTVIGSQCQQLKRYWHLPHIKNQIEYLGQNTLR